jgi:hypothetical protein
MSVIGTVKNGVVELPTDAQLVEGQRVEIVPVFMFSKEADALRETAIAAQPVLDLPDDLAANHDYYLHGHDHKQQPRRGRWIPAGKPSQELTASEAEDFAVKLLALAAETRNLPPDLAMQHNYYLHGLPKQ